MKRVALLIETTRSYSRDILAGVSRYVHEKGPWSTFLELRLQESEPPSWLSSWDGDGILARTFHPAVAAAIEATGLPVIELRSTHFNREVPFVGMDNAMLGQRVAEHFLNLGYRSLAAYSLSAESFFEERIQNFVDRAEQRSITCPVLSSQGDTSPADWEAHQEELIQWLRQLRPPVGILAANDQLGFRLIDACCRAGLAVPEEVAVVGCENDLTLCEFSNPTLSSMEFDGKTVGYTAAGLLDWLMEGEEISTLRHLIPPKGIVQRGSSSEWVLEDPLVLAAVRRIREQAILELSVAELCDGLNVSRSTLERRMKAALGRGAKEEMLRLRFREVQRLLRNTDLTVEAIADATGFRHPHYLQTAFKERFGRTPGEFRREAIGRMGSSLLD